MSWPFVMFYLYILTTRVHNFNHILSRHISICTSPVVLTDWYSIRNTTLALGSR